MIQFPPGCFQRPVVQFLFLFLALLLLLAAGCGGGEDDGAGLDDLMDFGDDPVEDSSSTAPVSGGTGGVAAMRSITSTVVELGPLDTNRVDTPFLSPEDIEYLQALGPPMWSHARVWLLLREQLRVEHVYWNVDDLAGIIKEVRGILLAPEAQFRADDDRVGPRVQAYVEDVLLGFEALRDAVQRMEEAEQIFRDVGPGGVLGADQADRLLLVSTEVNQAIWEYHRIISRYGCSVCGELFRAIR